MSVCQTALNVPIWSVDSRENNWNCCQLATRSHILRLQFNAPNSISVGAPLQCSAYSAPQTPYLDFRGCTSKGSEGMGTGEKGKGRGGKEMEVGPPCPSFPIRYATGSGEPFAASGTGWPDLAWGFSDREMTWLLYCGGATTVEKPHSKKSNSNITMPV